MKQHGVVGKIYVYICIYFIYDTKFVGILENIPVKCGCISVFSFFSYGTLLLSN